MEVTVNENQIRMVLSKLNMVWLEILRLRAMLPPEEELSEEEKKYLEEARREVEEGAAASLENLLC